MAGEAVLGLGSSPDIYQYVQYGPITTPADALFPFVSNDQVVIDEAYVIYNAVGSASASIQLFRGIIAQPSGVDTLAEIKSAGLDITAVKDLTVADTEFTIQALTIQTDNNILEPGNVIMVDIEGTTTSMILTLILRLRTKSNL